MRKRIKRNLIVSEKAIQLLTHPFSLACVFLLLANDLFLRRYWPSWWTGKLSDAAWLGFVPFLAAALLAWLVPQRLAWRRREDLAFSLAFAVVGLGFTAVKILPTANMLATRIFGFLLQAAPAISFDPSDLLVLPALLLPFYLWQRQRNSTSTAQSNGLLSPDTQLPPSRTTRALIILPLIAIALLADAPAPDPGFTCFKLEYGKVYASAGYNAYVSADGGLTWDTIQPGSSINCPLPKASAAGWTEVAGPVESRRYRYQPGEEIQVSNDGGATWQTGMRFEVVSEAQRYYVLRSRDGAPVYAPGPLDAVADAASGNMLFAMGQEGVVVHQAGGSWVRSGKDGYANLENFPSSDAFFFMLDVNMILALILALLVYATAAIRQTFHPIRLIVLIIVWAGWLIINIIFPPANTLSYTAVISGAGTLLIAVFIVPLVIEQTVRLARRAPRKILLLAVVGLGAGLLYLLPFALWIYDILPRFTLANAAALISAAAFTTAGLLLAGKRRESS